MIGRIRHFAYSVFLVFFLAIVGGACIPMMLFGKKASRRTVQVWGRMAIFFLKPIAGISYRVEGAENIPTGGAIIASNHQSMWETMAIYALAPNPVIVFKKELLYIPVYGWWARAAGNITIDRSGGAKALRALARSAKDHIEAGEQLIIFPEGTRVPPGEETAFQPGVAGIYTAANAPCVPAAHDSGRFWRHHEGKMAPGCITLRFLPAIPAGLDRKTFMKELHDAITTGRPDL